MDGQPLAPLGRQFGTPLFVFSRRQIEANVAMLRDGLQSKLPALSIYYACKANSNRSILKILRGAGLGLEVSSSGELWKGQQVGFDGNQILFNAVAKSDDEIERALSARCMITIDSLCETHRCITISRRLNLRLRALLRIVPGIHSSNAKEFHMSSADSRFGMEPDEAYQALELILAYESADEVGLHLHLGGQISQVSAYEQAVQFVLDFLNAGHQPNLGQVRWPSIINLGGGLPCRYPHVLATIEQMTSEERAILNASLDLAALARALKPLSDHGLRLALEPGRFFVANTAVLLTRVTNEKHREDGTHWLLLDSSCGTLMDIFIYRWLFEMVSPERMSEPHRVPYHVGGPLCDAGDVFQSMNGGGHQPRYRALPLGTREGNLLAFFDVGAYSLEQLNEYNGRLMPAVLLIDDGTPRIIRRRQVLEDLFHYDPE